MRAASLAAAPTCSGQPLPFPYGNYPNGFSTSANIRVFPSPRKQTPGASGRQSRQWRSASANARLRIARWSSPSAANSAWVTGCRDDASWATDGLPSAADAPLQRSELAKSANPVGSRSAIPDLAVRQLIDRKADSRRMVGTVEVVESPGGISPPGAPRTVHDPLESHGSRCSAVAMT